MSWALQSSMCKVLHGTTCCTTLRDHRTEAGPAIASSLASKDEPNKWLLKAGSRASSAAADRNQVHGAKACTSASVILQLQGLAQASVKGQG